MTVSKEGKATLPDSARDLNQRSDQTLSRLPSVIRRCGLSRSSIYAMVARGEFPAPIKIGSRSVAFIDREVDCWIADRVAASRNLEAQ